MINKKQSFVKWKVRLAYVSSYVTPFGIVIVATQTVQEKLILVGVNIEYLVLLSAILMLMFLFAWLLDFFGIFEEELNFQTSRNTLLTDIIKGNKK